MKNIDVINYSNGLHSPEVKSLKGVKLVYAINKNKAWLLKEAETLLKSGDPDAEFQEFSKLREELAKTHSLLNKQDEPLVKINSNGIGEYQIDPAKQHVFNAGIKDLKEKFAVAIERNKQQNEDFQKMLEEEAVLDHKIHMVSIDVLPEDISEAQMSAIFFMIEHN